MQQGLLFVAVASGLATMVFILVGLHRAFLGHKTLGVRALVLTTLFSLLTGAFSIWQLVLAAQQLPSGR
jgi:hypothetical protein